MTVDLSEWTYFWIPIIIKIIHWGFFFACMHKKLKILFRKFREQFFWESVRYNGTDIYIIHIYLNTHLYLNFIENRQNSQFFANNFRNTNFSCSWYILNVQFLFINTLLFRPKLAKLVTYCENTNFSLCRYFLNV